MVAMLHRQRLPLVLLCGLVLAFGLISHLLAPLQASRGR
jgi:hypothetical protein